MNQSIVCILGLALFLNAGGCGEPIPVTPSAGSAEGLWSGATSTNRAVTVPVLEDGTYYLFYSAVGNQNQIGGVIQGTGSASTGTFNSTNTKDYAIGGNVLDATISGTYGARQFLNGSVVYAGGGTLPFTSSYNPAYDTTPIMASLAGVYQVQAGRAGGAQPATITVLADGTYTGTEQNGCQFTGRAAPRTRGNIFDHSMAFGGAPCFFAGSTLTGIWYFDITTRRLYAAAPTSTRTDAAILFGTKIL